jgi:two-component system, chemotaxis family, protein-glutamate methylesterase/glutaminase
MKRDVVVVGASAGGIEALSALLAPLPVDLPATILIVLHLPRRGPSVLASILDRTTVLPVAPAHAREPLCHGIVRVAPPNHHLVVEDGSIVLDHGPSENGHRPSVDVLFRSAARAVGGRTIGVVLSGTLDDGTTGARLINNAGGLVAVQDPKEAAHPSMPRNVWDHADVDHIGSAADLAHWLVEAVASEAPDPPDPPAHSSIAGPVVETQASGLTCPTCQGPLSEEPEGGLTGFRCRIGHRWSLESLKGEHDDTVERAITIAVRLLDEDADLNVRLAERADAVGRRRAASAFRERAEESRRQSERLRRVPEQLVASGEMHDLIR